MQRNRELRIRSDIPADIVSKSPDSMLMLQRACWHPKRGSGFSEMPRASYNDAVVQWSVAGAVQIDPERLDDGSSV